MYTTSIPFSSVEELIHMVFVKNEYIPSIFLSVEVTIHILSLIRPVPVSPEALHDDGSGNDRRGPVEGGSAGVSLGNARLDQSYEHIVSHVNNTNSQWVKRAGVHALRDYHHDHVSALTNRLFARIA